MYSTHRTIVVWSAPGEPLIARRLDELPTLLLSPGSIIYIDNTAFQQTHPARFGAARGLKGGVKDANLVLRELLAKAYGLQASMMILEYGILHFGEDNPTGGGAESKGLITTAGQGLKPDVEDVILVPCRVLTDADQLIATTGLFLTAAGLSDLVDKPDSAKKRRKEKK